MLKRKALFTTFFATILLFPQFVVATPLQQQEPKEVTKLESVQEIKDYVLTKKDVNVLLYDESGKIHNEFHSDGNVIQYYYDSQGNMLESIDSFNGKQVYEKDKSGIQKVKVYKDAKLVEEKELVEDSENSKSISEIDEFNLSTVSLNEFQTSSQDTIIKGINMSQLISDTDFTNSTALTYDEIQAFLENKNSILKNTVLIYYLDSNGNPYFKGDTINAASAISSAAKSYGINPKVILVTLQKESSLVTAVPGSVSYSSRRFYYAMGYGATDSGDDKSKAGFNLQISGGTATLKNRYNEAPSNNYPRKLPDGTVTSINYGTNKTSGGVTYNNYVWVNNRATYSLYRYTPHTIDINLLPTVGGGNYLFVSIAKGWWSDLWS